MRKEDDGKTKIEEELIRTVKEQKRIGEEPKKKPSKETTGKTEGNDNKK